MRIKGAVIGIALGVIAWHTDTFQRIAFPADYWTEKINEIDADIAFTQELIDSAGKDGNPDDRAIWEEFIADEKDRRHRDMAELAKATAY